MLAVGFSIPPLDPLDKTGSAFMHALAQEIIFGENHASSYWELAKERPGIFADYHSVFDHEWYAKGLAMRAAQTDLPERDFDAEEVDSSDNGEDMDGFIVEDEDEGPETLKAPLAGDLPMSNPAHVEALDKDAEASAEDKKVKVEPQPSAPAQGASARASEELPDIKLEADIHEKLPKLEPLEDEMPTQTASEPVFEVSAPSFEAEPSQNEALKEPLSSSGTEGSDSDDIDDGISQISLETDSEPYQSDSVESLDLTEDEQPIRKPPSSHTYGRYRSGVMILDHRPRFRAIRVSVDEEAGAPIPASHPSSSTVASTSNLPEPAVQAPNRAPIPIRQPPPPPPGPIAFAPWTGAKLDPHVVEDVLTMVLVNDCQICPSIIKTSCSMCYEEAEGRA
jgi:hypothetical protein